jgi:hypothetical protein
MTKTPMPDERRFTDEEVREIIRRAVERPQAGAVARRDGLSLAELKTIGAEVGIDPARLEEAAQAVAAGDQSGAGAITGVPRTLYFERTVDGSIEASDTADVLSTVRRIMGHHGDVREIHDSLEWSTSGDAGTRHVTVTSKDGHTTIRTSANLTTLAVVSYLPAGVLGVIATTIGTVGFAESGSVLALLGGVSALPVLYGVVRGMLRRVTRSESAKLQRVIDDVAAMVRSAESE